MLLSEIESDVFKLPYYHTLNSNEVREQCT